MNDAAGTVTQVLSVVDRTLTIYESAYRVLGSARPSECSWWKSEARQLYHMSIAHVT
ncbi:hypothetical protein [Candidatus Nitrospira nitrificans]|uniref:Uncharacterized protein n=1 Tax=Candidatus Nitrospira nitrificans TaxID=1742973 RepID=A0A0S4LTY6_9BACT|nr:hypothetical protein [Candidatus Nitrospira nitrificans]CUS39992.1 hypothetical protein COMA2_90171 [Candidatus Nitrospira nitrificans]